MRPDERFAMQSVMKLLVGIAALDAVDTRGWRLDDAITIYKQDLSLYVQPIARLVTNAGYTTNVGDLIRRAIIDSDSAATDILIARLGGAPAAQQVLLRKGLLGIRIDRDERHLQTEIAGIAWRPEFVDPELLNRAIESVPEARRTKAFAQYQADPRDTATPRGMVEMLSALGAGKLLSAPSTAFILQAMQDTVTGPDRLKAGMAPGWTLGHKTGTSGTWHGVTAATNDIGILTSPKGRKIAVAVFVGDSRASDTARAAAIAKVAAAVSRISDGAP